jgi:2,3-bisphosphoglycerate-independent phosphoglycerate mutase
VPRSDTGQRDRASDEAELGRPDRPVPAHDHGNAEKMRDEATGQAHTAHTLCLVPLVYVGREATMASGGALQDVAPTLLAMLGLPQPPEMTGRSLLAFA